MAPSSTSVEGWQGRHPFLGPDKTNVSYCVLFHDPIHEGSLVCPLLGSCLFGAQGKEAKDVLSLGPHPSCLEDQAP